MEEAFASYLLGHAPLTALIGASPNSRLTWAVRQQSTPLPAIVVTKIDSAPVYADEGDVGLVESRMQIDVWGATYGSTKAVARAVMARLSGAEFTHQTTEFQSVFADAERDGFEIGAGEERLYRVSLDFIVWHSPDAPESSVLLLEGDESGYLLLE